MSHTHVVRRAIPALALAGTLILSAAPLRAQQAVPAPATPAEMVAAYNSLADAILAVKKTEEGLVRSIVAATYAHARAELEHARQAFAAKDMKAAQGAIEMAAAEVGQLATEGDAAVGAVRKRLLEGGHHHHANEEAQGIYDEGYVVVTRAAKQAFLDASRTLAQVARDPKADAMEAEWKKVQATYNGLMK
jgi:hypothetical protein